MYGEDKPRGFDWVTAYYECKPVRYLERLRCGAERNTRTRNNLDGGQDGLRFACDGHPDAFSVFREGHAGIEVRFRLAEETVHVEATELLGGPGVNFAGTLTLTQEAKFRLRVGEEELDEWQVLRRALARLFFPA